MRFTMLQVCLLLSLCVGAARAEDELHVVRQSYALPDEGFLSLSIDPGGANVKLETGPAGLVEAVFHVPDSARPPVFGRYEWADSGDLGSFQWVRHPEAPAPEPGELWEIRIPREMDFASTQHAGFTDIALWEIDDMLLSIDSDSTNMVVDLSSLEAGRLTVGADALNGNILLYVPKSAEVTAVARCTLGVFSAPGFADVDVADLAPGLDSAYAASWQGLRWQPAAPGGAQVSLTADAARGDVSVIQTGK